MLFQTCRYFLFLWNTKEFLLLGSAKEKKVIGSEQQENTFSFLGWVAWSVDSDFKCIENLIQLFFLSPPLVKLFIDIEKQRSYAVISKLP